MFLELRLNRHIFLVPLLFADSFSIYSGVRKQLFADICHGYASKMASVSEMSIACNDLFITILFNNIWRGRGYWRSGVALLQIQLRST